MVKKLLEGRTRPVVQRLFDPDLGVVFKFLDALLLLLPCGFVKRRRLI